MLGGFLFFSVFICLAGWLLRVMDDDGGLFLMDDGGGLFLTTRSRAFPSYTLKWCLLFPRFLILSHFCLLSCTFSFGTEMASITNSSFLWILSQCLASLVCLVSQKKGSSCSLEHSSPGNPEPREAPPAPLAPFSLYLSPSLNTNYINNTKQCPSGYVPSMNGWSVSTSIVWSRCSKTPRPYFPWRPGNRWLLSVRSLPKHVVLLGVWDVSCMAACCSPILQKLIVQFWWSCSL